MKRKELKIIILLLVVIEGVFVYLNYKSYNNKENYSVFSEVRTADNLKDSKQIAIKLQNENFGWDDKGTSASSWPDKEIFEYYGSECTDASGSPITPTTDVIQFDLNTWKATISTSKTIYCTLKFARRSTVLKLMQKTTNGTYLKTIAENDELLRYVGTKDDVTYDADKDNPKAINNFICFGTENKDACLGDKNTYMYRIIGITTKNVNGDLGLVKDQLKIIKAVPGFNYLIDRGWGSGYQTWDNASLQITLNGTGSNQFLGTITGDIASGKSWQSLISNPKWYIGESDNAQTAQGISEEKTKISTNHKIGLMYASDYYNSVNQSNKDKNSWLYISNGMTESSSSYRDEWTINIRRRNSDAYSINQACTNGVVGSNWIYNWSQTRPVFYLTNEISISGEGTESNPFLISDRIIT